jgi:high potential iron-sulfur protein
MQDPVKPVRRQLLKAGGAALAAIPVMVFSGRSQAATNAQMRTALKYQDKPLGDKSCSGCVQFVPGKTAKDLGGCKAMPGDTEISPNGYCAAWAVKPKG